MAEGFKRLTLKNNFAWAFLGNVISAFSMWLILVVLAKWGSPQMVGVYGVAQALCLPISTFVSLKLPVVQVTDVNNDYDFSTYFTLRVLTVIIVMLSCLIAGSLFYSVDVLVIILLLAAGYGIMETREIFLTVMRKSERMDKVANSRIYQSILSVVLFIIFFHLTRSLPWGIFALFLARTIVWLIYDVPVAKQLMVDGVYKKKINPFELNYNQEKLIKLMLTALPLGFVGCFSTLFNSLPRLFLDKYFDKETVGYFTAIASLLAIGNMVIAAMNQSVAPRLAYYYQNNINAYKNLLGKLFVVAIVVGICGILISMFFGKWILTIMFTPEYAKFSDILVWVAISGMALFVFHFANTGLNAARKFKIQMPIYAIAAGVCLLSSFFLIPSFGMKGAIGTILLSYLTGAGISVVLIIYAIKTKQRKLYPN